MGCDMLEEKRLESLYSYDILDSQEEEELNDLTRFAARIFDMPIALITIIDKNRQWFKSHFGVDINETPISHSICRYTILSDDILEIKNTETDERFLKNPLLRLFPNIKYYCGAPLINEGGFRLGSLCVIDTKPRSLNYDQKNILKLLAKQVVNHFELEHKRSELEKVNTGLENQVKERTKEIENKMEEITMKDETLIKINKDLDNFIYTASHDLKAPIINIESLLNTLNELLDECSQKECKQNEDILEVREMIDTSVERFKRTIHDLTNISNSQKIAERSQEENEFQDIFDETIMDIHDLIIASNAKIMMDFSECETVRFPKKDLRSIAYNMLSNAIKYRSPERECRVNIKTKKINNKYVLLTVQDNGLGISEANKGKMFDMFKRFHNNIEGTGVGLYIVGKMVDNMGGKIEVESELGKGSVFKIYLKNND